MNGAPQSVAQRPLSIAIVAAEESGDALGAALAKALRAREGEALKLSGVGGRAMAAAGIVSPFPIDDLAIVGLTAIPQKLPLIFRRIRETVEMVVAARPRCAGHRRQSGFHPSGGAPGASARALDPDHRLCLAAGLGLRPGRARAMRAYIDHVLAILPFEPAAHERLGGPPCTYVGHPLSGRIAELRPNADEAARRQSAPPLVLARPAADATRSNAFLACSVKLSVA